MRLQAKGYDEDGQERVVATWDPTSWDVELEIESEVFETTLPPHVAEPGEPRLPPEENLEIWTRLVYQHRLNVGEIKFSEASDLGKAVGLSNRTLQPTTSDLLSERVVNVSRPRGTLDLVTKRELSVSDVRFRVAGWVCDADSFATPVPVVVRARNFLVLDFPDGTQRVRTTDVFIDESLSENRTSLVREDVRSQCGGTATHGFDFEATGSCSFNLLNEVEIEVFGIDLNSDGSITGPVLMGGKIRGRRLNGTPSFAFVRC